MRDRLSKAFHLRNIRQKLTIRQVLRFIVLLPFRLLRFLLLLPFRFIWLLVRLPRKTWHAWKRSAKWLADFRKDSAAHLRAARRVLRLYAHPRRIGLGLYFHLHPGRILHLLCRMRSGLTGRRARSAVPELAVIAKALVWARQYHRHESRFQGIEALRSRLYVNEMRVRELPAQPTIALLARRQSVPPRWGALLHGLARYTAAQRILELGTGFGISGMYMAQGMLDVYPMRTCLLVTLEHSRDFMRLADDHFRRLGYDDIVETITGDFADTFARALENVAPVNIAFIDAPLAMSRDDVLRYFSRIKAHSQQGTLIVLSGIHSTPEMRQAWHMIKKMPRIAATTDLWRWGIVIVGSGPAVHVCAKL